jgi:hypothetical protein
MFVLSYGLSFGRSYLAAMTLVFWPRSSTHAQVGFEAQYARPALL